MTVTLTFSADVIDEVSKAVEVKQPKKTYERKQKAPVKSDIVTEKSLNANILYVSVVML